MNWKPEISFKLLSWKLLFLCLPTCLMMFFLLKLSEGYLPVFNSTTHNNLLIFFGLGIITSCIFHSYKFRFIPFFIVLLILFWGGGEVLDNITIGEFDTFNWSIVFFLFKTLFIAGWICGWGFARSRYFSAVLASLLLGFGIYLVSLSGSYYFREIIRMFTPILLFSFYIIWMNELLRNINERQKNAWLAPIRGLSAYLLLMAALFALTFTVFKKDFEALEVKWTGAVDMDDNSMYQINPDSTIQMKNDMQVNNNRGGGAGPSFPLFVAYLDNFFPNTEIPNPLYFVSEYLPLFDDFTETFEADPKMPYNDLFLPNPTKIPLYFTEHDSSVLANGMSNMYRKTVEAEVYKIRASPTEFTAPSTAFFCQPIAVKSELRDQFTAAYRAKMWVSELNSAYFVYNNIGKDVSVGLFQEQRFDLLRQISDYKDLDTNFYNYYTRLPINPAYDTIKTLTEQIINKADAKTPIDKILAIRDFFMQNDENGKAVFKYSDKGTLVPPGSRLLNFLFNEHVGNCTYYAGSTLLMLRSIGIPARVATGYALVDRSSNNKGWYWIYNKQAHAWVQVFFPDFGWLDFDTTFGDEEREDAPSTDGTPPLDPQKAWFAGTGTLDQIDTIKSSASFMMEKMVYFDLEYKLESPHRLTLDLSLAKIQRDSLELYIRDLKSGDKGLALSFVVPENISTNINPQDVQMILVNLPKPIPVDEFRVESANIEKVEPQKEKLNQEAQPHKKQFRNIILLILGLIIFLLLFVFTIPYIIFKIYARKAKAISYEKQAYYPYRSAMFLLHQMGYYRGTLTPMQFAGKIDKDFGTGFEAFIATYLKSKYAGQPLNNEEIQRILAFYKPFEKTVMAKFSFKERLFKFMNIYNTLNYFTRDRTNSQ